MHKQNIWRAQSLQTGDLLFTLLCSPFVRYSFCQQCIKVACFIWNTNVCHAVVENGKKITIYICIYILVKKGRLGKNDAISFLSVSTPSFIRLSLSKGSFFWSKLRENVNKVTFLSFRCNCCHLRNCMNTAFTWKRGERKHDILA
jgi:hypothetical protein